VYDVTTFADVVNANDGVLSLREAVLAANASVGIADTINLPAGTYTLTLIGAGEDGAATGDLDVRDAVTIRGAGAAAAVLDGNATDRVFDVNPGTSGGQSGNRAIAVTLSGLTLATVARRAWMPAARSMWQPRV
jgi:CSLREA domain-containing protein